MSASRIITRGDAKVAINVNSTLLFIPGGDVYNWTARLEEKAKTRTKFWAPFHGKTTHWSGRQRYLRPHKSKELKRTIVASRPHVRKTKRGSQILAAIGSTAGHALYVDQGTGDYSGHGPYPAKILPPWKEGDPSLYEHSWNPGGRKLRNPVMIHGQKGQEFFDKGMRSAFKAMHIPSATLPAGSPRVEKALNVGWPLTLTGFSGSTTAEAGFLGDLELWREWRDTAWRNGDDLGKPRPRTQAKSNRSTAKKGRRQLTENEKQQIDLHLQSKRNTAHAKRDKAEDAKARENIQKNARSRVINRAKRQAHDALAIAKLAHPDAYIAQYINKEFVRYVVGYHDQHGRAHIISQFGEFF